MLFFFSTGNNFIIKIYLFLFHWNVNENGISAEVCQQTASRGGLKLRCAFQSHEF